MNELPLDAHLGEANALIDGGDFAGARALLMETTTTYPTAAAAWKRLGLAENKLGSYEAAERAMLKSLELDGSDTDAWSSLGGLYFLLARDDDALRCYERAMAVGTTSTYPLLNYLTLASIVGDTSALQRYGRALVDGERRCTAQIDQGLNLPWCYFDLGQILFFQGRHDDSRSVVRAALEHSNDWQVDSARRTYERLAEKGRFTEPARTMVLEFARHDRDRHRVSGDDPLPAG